MLTNLEQGIIEDEGEAKLLTLALVGIETTGATTVVGTVPEFRLSAATPIKDKAGQIIGAILVSRTFDDDFLARLNFSRTDIHLVLIYAGQFLAQHFGDLPQPNAETTQVQDESAELKAMFPNLPDPIELKQALQGQTVTVQNLLLNQLDQDRYAVIYLPVTMGGRTEAVIIIFVEVNELLAFESQLTNNLVLVFFLMGLTATAIMALFFQRSIARPLAQLNTVAQQMTKGDLTARVKLESRNEIGLLSISFNNMATQLQQTLSNLEQRVTERTHELAQANQQLHQEIAQHIQTQEDLTRSRDQALEANRLKTELLAKVSHELRTPLGAILGFAEMLETGIYGPISGQQQQAATEIIDSTYYLNNLVNELLDQARLDANRLSLNLTSFTPTTLFTGVLSKLDLLAQAKGLTLTTEIAPDLPATLFGDPDRLQQIIINLVSNAIKFTEWGTVQVRLYSPDSHHWALQVSDTGIGIPQEAQTYIFEPFRQVDGSITRGQGGSGLGLSIVKQLTTLMGGQLRLESEVGHGSSFTILLPLQLTS
ncbi:MAG: ATP-binding protein [Anaerolineae bacterium]